MAAVGNVFPSPAYADDVKADREIDTLVGHLGSGSFQQRNEATNRLLAMGPAAAKALRRVAKGDDFEAALRARCLLNLFDELLFVGADVALEVSPAEAAWSDDVALTVVVHNRTKSPMRVPFDTAKRLEQLPRVAREVATVLDLSDFLEVTAPDGRGVELYVDDINEDADTRKIVLLRADTPVVSLLPPGDSRRYVVRSINRAFARYRMLAAGTYRLRLIYQPQWDDPELIKAGVGRVESNSATITVTRAAPKELTESRSAAGLRLRRSGDVLTAELINLTDRPAFANVNLGGSSTAPFATLIWVVTHDGERWEGIPPQRVARDVKFSRDRFLAVKPVAAVEVERVSILALFKAAGVTAPGPTTTIHATYSNQTSAAWQRLVNPARIAHAQAAKVLQKPLPAGVLCTTVHAPPVAVQSP